MRHRLIALAMAMTASWSTGCAGGGSSGTPPQASAASTDSGIEGRTAVSGDCPVIRNDSPCPDKPLSARLTVTRPNSDAPVAHVTSDAGGRFHLPLPPGRYVLHPSNLTGARHPAAAPVEVEVSSGVYTAVTVPFDSGIR